jgi:hypothetical protein
MAHPAIGLEKPAIAVAAMKSSKRKALSLPRQFIAEYIAWTNMRQRCHSKNPHYGGRGISICKRWDLFANFIADMGPRPTDNHSLDRINNDGNYEPGNCRWATRIQQANNTRLNLRVVFQGETLTVAELSRRTGVSKARLQYRVRHMSAEEAVAAKRYAPVRLR